MLPDVPLSDYGRCRIDQEFLIASSGSTFLRMLVQIFVCRDEQ